MSFVKRKTCHLILSLILFPLLLFLLATYGKQQTLLIAGGILLFFLIYDYTRIEFGIRYFTSMVKEKEQQQHHAITLAVAAFIICLSLVDQQVALAAISISLFADWMAAVVGKAMGKHSIKKKGEKTWEGFIAYWLTGTLVALFFVTPIMAILMALLGAFVEGFAEKIEDNFIAPLAMAALGWLLMILL